MDVLTKTELPEELDEIKHSLDELKNLVKHIQDLGMYQLYDNFQLD